MNFKNIKDVLTRIEMKEITAGGIQCTINGAQKTCVGGTLLQCASACSNIYGYGCGGCGQF